MSEQQRSFAVRTLLAVLVFNGLLIGALYVTFGDGIQSGFLFGLGLLATVLLWVTLIALGNRFVASVQRTSAPVPAPVRDTPRPVAPKGVTVTTIRGQRVSLERGSHTRSKKNTGKRAKSGG